MATKIGINIYITPASTGIKIKHNTTPQVDNQTAYNISDVVAPGESFGLQFSNVYDDGGESALTALQTHVLLVGGTISLKQLSFESTTTVFPQADYKGNHRNTNTHWHPFHIVNGNKTIATQIVSTDARIHIIEYDNRYGIRPIHRMIGSDGTNYHDKPVIHIENNKVHLVQEKSHENNPMKLHIALEENDSLIFNCNAQDIGTRSNSYPNIYKQDDGKLITVGQRGVEASFLASQSGSITGPWDTGVHNGFMILRAADESDRYQTAINNKHNHGDIIFGSFGLQRPTVEIANFFRANLFRIRLNADGTLNWYTFDGRTILLNTNQKISAPEVAMGQYYELTDGVNNSMGLPIIDLDSEGNFYSILKGDSNYIFTIWEPTNQTPVNKSITFPDNPTLVENIPWANKSCLLVMPENLDKVHSFWRVDNGTRFIIRQYTTINRGDSWAFVQDIDFGFSVDGFTLIQNWDLTGNDKNFLAVANGLVTGDEFYGTSDIAVKRASFGAIQPETNIYDSLIPITDNTYNSTSVVSIFAENGKINKTTNVVNSFIDQSPNAATIATLGSPVLDDATTPTYLQMDGINDAVSLNPALLAANKNYLFIGVIDHEGGSISLPSISNNVNNNSFILPSVDAASGFFAHKSRQNTTLLNHVNGDTPLTTGFHIYAALYRGYGYDVPKWVDGKMQMRKVVTDFTFLEGMYTLPNGNTHLELGRLVRSTTGYEKFKLKHFAIHEVTSEAQILDRIKFLGDKYGITLLNAYR